MCRYTYKYVCTGMHVCVHTTHVSIWAHTCLYMHVCIHHTCMFMGVHMYIYMYAYMDMHVFSESFEDEFHFFAPRYFRICFLKIGFFSCITATASWVLLLHSIWSACCCGDLLGGLTVPEQLPCGPRAPVLVLRSGTLSRGTPLQLPFCQNGTF